MIPENHLPNSSAEKLKKRIFYKKIISSGKFG